MSSATAPPPAGADGLYLKGAIILLGFIGGLQVVDPVISSTALVNASDSLNFSAATQSLAAGISTLALAATVIPGGMLADRLGRKRMLMIALIVAAAGDLITAFAPDTTFYLLGRAVAGVGLGVMFAASFALLRVVAAQKIGSGMGLFNILNMVVAIFLGFLGGAVATANWRFSYIFVPAGCLVAFLLVPRVIPKVPTLPATGKTDYLGMILVGVGVTAILYGVSKATISLLTPSVLVPVGIGIAALALFVVAEHKVSNPVFPVRLLQHPAFLGAALMGLIWNFGNAAILQMLANIWQYVMEFNTVQVSMGQLPMTLAGIVGAAIAGKTLGRGSLPRTVSVFGFALMTIGFVLFTFIKSDAGYLAFLPGMLIAACGWMMNATSQGQLFLVLAPARFFGPVTSSKVTVGQFGYSFGLSGSTALVSLLTLDAVKSQTNGAVSGDEAWSGITEYLTTGTAPAGALQDVTRLSIQQAYTHSFDVTMGLIGIVMAVGGAVVWLLLKSKNADIDVDEFIDNTHAVPAK